MNQGPAAGKRLVTLLGRPNVGKSTLFNRILGGRPALVHSRPGSTRDGRLESVEWGGVSFDLQDTGGAGAPDAGPFAAEIRELAERTAARSDVVAFLVDARDGCTHADGLLAENLRRRPDPERPRVVLVVNKAEGRFESASAEFHEFGLGEPMPISAEHGIGIGDLLDRIVGMLRETPGAPEAAAPADAAPAFRVAIVGRPNVGKSTLLNRLLGFDRALVSPVAGTTRDPVDERLTAHGQEILLVDTAGIRRGSRGRNHGAIEEADRVAMRLGGRALERAQAALLVADAREGPTALDAGIARLAFAAGCGVAVLLNRWDQVEEREARWRRLRQEVGARLRHLHDPPTLRISALAGIGIDPIWKAVFALRDRLGRRVPTPELNRFLVETTRRFAPLSGSGKPVKVLYGYQSGVFPPRFRVFLNRRPADLPASWSAYLTARMRKEFGFRGAPIRVQLEERRRRGRTIGDSERSR